MIQDNRYYDPSHMSFNSIRTNRCPKCKTGYMKVDKSIVLTSYPPKYKRVCTNCNYVDSVYVDEVRY